MTDQDKKAEEIEDFELARMDWQRMFEADKDLTFALKEGLGYSALMRAAWIGYREALKRRMPTREEMFRGCAEMRGDCAEWGPCYDWLKNEMDIE